MTADLTPMYHTIAALCMQAVIGFTTGNWFAGACFGLAFYIGRELTQAEKRWVRLFGGNLDSRLPWWGGFDPRVWKELDPWLDWIAPAIAVFAVVVIAR